MFDIPTQMQHLLEGRLWTHEINVSSSLEEKAAYAAEGFKNEHAPETKVGVKGHFSFKAPFEIISNMNLKKNVITIYNHVLQHSRM